MGNYLFFFKEEDKQRVTLEIDANFRGHTSTKGFLWKPRMFMISQESSTDCTRNIGSLISRAKFFANMHFHDCFTNESKHTGLSLLIASSLFCL